ncbi:hypothetical protein [Bradyrhizobium sp.]|uniref:hypothetical protein n=1 Tax=Bradyrhizobium sp. TaxID=376 RepID=UPI0025C67BE5|nr:hypothetical protein [Bradyrhizobium sp.]
MSALSPEDRMLYRQWLRRGLFLYGAIAIIGAMAISYHIAGPQPLATADSALAAAK